MICGNYGTPEVGLFSVLRSSRSRVLSAAAVLPLGAALLGQPAQAATGGPASPSPRPESSVERLMAAQAPLDAAGQRVLAAAARHSGLGSVSIDVARRELTVTWKGAVPAAVRDVLRRARSDGITTAVRAARFSQAELQAASWRIVGQAAPLRRQGMEIVAVRPNPDGSGLDVGVLRRQTAHPLTAAAAQNRLSAAVSAGIPLRVVAGRLTTPGGRMDDWKPHWAGARIGATGGGGATCTSGWPITRNSDGRTFILTAAHCSGSTWWSSNHVNPNASADDEWKFGDTWERYTPLDVQIIRSIVSGRTWDGPVNPYNAFSKPVDMAAGSQIVNLSVCESGSWSGAHCGLTVTGWEVTQEKGTGWYVRVTTARATNSDKIAMCRGDSGGPVFTLVPGNAGRVIARGIEVVLYDPLFNWFNGWDAQQPQCSTVVGFSDILSILNHYGASIMTG